MIVPIVITALLGAAVGVVAGYMGRQGLSRRAAASLEQLAAQKVKEAERESESIVREGRLQAKADVLKAREDFEKTTQSRRKELAELDERLSQREANLDRKVAMIDKKEHVLEEKLSQAEQRGAQLEKDRAEADRLVAQARDAIQRVAGMTQDEARKTLLARVEKELHNEAGTLIRRMQEEARSTAERESRNIVASALQRYGASHASEMMTSTVALPSDDLKGRIIGREGRNIRAMEAITGVNILIDDTPEAVVISGFDPIRREVAKQAMETLVADGRIHPARIEEVVERVRGNLEETIRTTGEEALFAVGVRDVNPELVRKLGRLKYRTSYTQNVLQHSMEVAQLMGVMAGELQLDVSLAKRVGLFHDIGKALDHEVEGGHAVIGADLLKRMGEPQVVVNAVAAHHEEVPSESVYGLLCSAADAISSSRVGARSETTEIYVKRLEKLEEVANSFEGVKKSYAIQAGREVRLLVDPEKLDDKAAQVLARNVSKKIESDLQYPGQIRVIVIRETRCVEFAR